jgi:hypothetical protein
LVELQEVADLLVEGLEAARQLAGGSIPQHRRMSRSVRTVRWCLVPHSLEELSPDEQDRVFVLCGQFIENCERLEQLALLAGVGASVEPPGGDFASAVAVMRAARSQVKAGYELYEQLMRDLEEVLAIVDVTS